MKRYVQGSEESNADFAIRVMTDLFVLVESTGSCFDVLVREAIERGERAPAATITTEPIDFSFDDSSYEVAARDFERKHGVTVNVVEEHGPGGGWPTVTLTGTAPDVERALHAGGWDQA